MANLLSFFGDIGKKLHGVEAQLNPWDNGENYQSVVNGGPRYQTPKPPSPSVNPASPPRAGFNPGVDNFQSPTIEQPKIDINANANLSQQQQQKQPQNDFLQQAGKFVNDNIIKPVAEDASKAYNTVAAPITGLTGAAMVGADNLFNGGKNADNLAAATKAAVQENVRNSFVPQNVAQGKATPLQFASGIAKTGIHLAPYAIPGGGKLVQDFGAKVAQNVGGRVLNPVVQSIARGGANAAISAPTFAALNAAQQGFDSGFKSFDPGQAIQQGLLAGVQTAGGNFLHDATAPVRNVLPRPQVPQSILASRPAQYFFGDNRLVIDAARSSKPRNITMDQLNNTEFRPIQPQSSPVLPQNITSGSEQVGRSVPEPSVPSTVAYHGSTQPMYRGASRAEWDAVKSSGRFGKQEAQIGNPRGFFNDDVHTVSNKKYAENYAYTGGQDGVVIEYKPSANGKIRNTSDVTTTDMGIIQESRGKGLTFDDVQRVTDRNGNVLYDAGMNNGSRVVGATFTRGIVDLRTASRELKEAGFSDQEVSDLLSDTPQTKVVGKQAVDSEKLWRNADLYESRVNPERSPDYQDKVLGLQSTNDQGLNSNFSQLPTVKVKPVRALDKVFRSTRSIIERQGESGKQLANMLQGARDTQEIYLGQLQKAMPTVTKIAKPKAIGKDSWMNKTFENFVDAVEGNAPPKTPEVAQAVAEWKSTAPAIRERAVQAGLDVGDLGPNYYPHFVDYEKVFKDRNTYNEALNHLVKTGQAPNIPEAIKLLGYARDVSRNRSFGNLEASRIVDLPFYDKTPNTLISYLNGSAKRIAHTETFGAKDENALKLLSKIGLEGGDTEAAKNAFDIAAGAKKYNQSLEKTSANIRKYITTTRLGLGALTNVSQNVNTGIVTGHLRTFGAMVKQLKPETRDFVQNTGVISDALLNDLRTQSGTESFTSKVFGKAVNKVTAPLFGTVEKFNRAVAATAGRDYALRLAQAGKVDTLRKLGVTGEIKGQTLTEAQQVQAARKIVEKTQFKVDPQDLPGWVDSPGGKLVSQFRTFSYAQGKFFSNEILKPAAKGNVLPLARLLASIPLGYALFNTRAALTNQSPEDDKLKIALNSFNKVGGAGLAMDIYNGLNPVGSKYLPSDRRVSMAVSTFGGPAAGLLAQGVGAASEAVQNKNLPTDETRLEGKVALKSNDGETYKDLTPAARLGLSQVPIVGTRLQNTILPYSKESNADSGNPGPIVAGKTSPADAVKSLNRDEKKKLDKLKKAVGSDTYALSNLSSFEKKQLVDRGIASQDQIEAAEKTVKDKRVEMGLDTVEKEKAYKDQYNEAKKEYDKKSGSWSSVEKAEKKKELARLSVQKDYTKDTVNLYGMSKGDVWNLVSTDKNGKKLVEDILKYGDALVAAGLTKQNKFRDKYGNVKLESSSAGGKGKSKKKSSGIDQASIRELAYKSKVPTFKAPPKGSSSAVSAAQFRKTALKRYSPRLPQAPKARVV